MRPFLPRWCADLSGVSRRGSSARWFSCWRSESPWGHGCSGRLRRTVATSGRCRRDSEPRESCAAGMRRHAAARRPGLRSRSARLRFATTSADISATTKTPEYGRSSGNGRRPDTHGPWGVGSPHWFVADRLTSNQTEPRPSRENGIRTGCMIGRMSAKQRVTGRIMFPRSCCSPQAAPRDYSVCSSSDRTRPRHRPAINPNQADARWAALISLPTFSGAKNSMGDTVPAVRLTNMFIASWSPCIAPSSCCISGGGGSIVASCVVNS